MKSLPFAFLLLFPFLSFGQDFRIYHQLINNAERMKMLRYNGIDASLYFWRTTQQQEIDLIEEHEGGVLKAFEFKWGKNAKVRFPQTFTENYPAAEAMVISPENVAEFLIQ